MELYYLYLNMKTLVTILFMLILSYESKAQTDTISATDKRVNDKIQELRNDRVDTIICYYINCIGSEISIKNDSCVAYAIKYLLWSNHGNHYIQRFDECKEHGVSETSKTVFLLLKNNYSEIKIRKIKYPKFTFKENGKPKTYYSFIDHSCHNIFEIHAGNEILKKDIDDFALETKYDEKKHVNKRFYSNKKSILNKLKILVEYDVSAYNKTR